MGDDGLAEGYQELPEGSVDDARQAAEDCPVGAITVK
jgi:ferredoxin